MYHYNVKITIQNKQKKTTKDMWVWSYNSTNAVCVALNQVRLLWGDKIKMIEISDPLKEKPKSGVLAQLNDGDRSL